jgi:uncharacterized protein (TIGR00369 family)
LTPNTSPTAELPALTTARSPDEHARVESLIRSIFTERIPFNQVLGLQVLSLERNEIGFDMRPELVGHFDYGRLHGGVISATLDVVGSFGLMNAIATRHPTETVEQIGARFKKMGTVDLRVDYLRSGQGKTFLASAEVTRLGRRIGSTRMTLHNDSGVLIATGAAVYVVA